MKLLIPCLACFAVLQLNTADHAVAQPSKTSSLDAPPANIAIDGDIKEWGDSLRYYNAEKHFNYALANDKDNLYMAIRIVDRTEQIRILRAGLTFSADTKGKKKETFSITFPLSVQGDTPPPPENKGETGEITQQDRDELMRERITNLRGIKVVGFKDIDGDMITTTNTYGIKTAINYNEQGDLVCEAEIPLSFFHAEASKSEWAFNFKINGIQRRLPANGTDPDGGGGSHGGRGGMGGGGMGGGRGGRGGGKGGGNRGNQFGAADHSELSKSEDFWEKFYLAK